MINFFLSAIAAIKISPPSILAGCISFLTIFTLIFGRYEIRLRRLRMIRDYVTTFPNTVHSQDYAGVNPSFEFVRSKYSADINSTEADSLWGSKLDDQISQIDRTISTTRFFGNRGDLRLLIAAISYAVVVYWGFRLVFTCVVSPASGTNWATNLWLNLFLVGGTKGANTLAENPALLWSAQNTATIACFVFIGGYASSLRYMVQALSVFDLQAFTFVRQTAVLVVSVLLTIALYRALPNPFSILSGEEWTTTAPPLSATNPGVSVFWLLLALAFGLLPESAAQFAVIKSSPLISWIKSTDDRFIEWTRVVPLDAIDGIDYFIRFRLEECGIAEVQSLATYNPIMLHIETPYGIYQAIDWIAQAQLCCVVGLDRFLLLRQFNVRTIFDLERVIVQDETMDKERRKVIDVFDNIYAAVLLSPNRALNGVQKLSGAKFLITSNGAIKEVDAAEFSVWARTLINADPKSASIAVEHIMRWIGDDLHVRRLRRLWNEISVRLGPDSVGLFSDDQIKSHSITLQEALSLSKKVS